MSQTVKKSPKPGGIVRQRLEKDDSNREKPIKIERVEYRGMKFVDVVEPCYEGDGIMESDRGGSGERMRTGERDDVSKKIMNAVRSIYRKQK